MTSARGDQASSGAPAQPGVAVAGPVRRLFVGGSFNPPHHGHLLVARAVAEHAGYDRVSLVPSADPPHKPQAMHLAPADHRLAMCRLAAAADPFFEVLDLELRRPGPSYTADTAAQLLAASLVPPDEPVRWLIGADLVPTLPAWHRAAGLLAGDLLRFVVARRPDTLLDWSALPAAVRPLEREVVEAPLIDISATTIRRRIATGMSIEYLTPPAVVKYILANSLYTP